MILETNMRETRSVVLGAVGLLLLASGAGCTKKVAVAPPPPPPKFEAPEPVKPAPPVVAVFVVEPATIERGQSASLRWRVLNATRVEIDRGIGAVAASGDRRVSPDEPTTYLLLASGPGGEASASATLKVNLPPPPAPPPAVPPTISERLSKEVQDVYFDFDRSEIRPDARDTLSRNAPALKSILSDFPTTTVILEGHCDERGSAEYNLALGDRRAAAVKTYLNGLGIGTQNLLVISYGKEKPQCAESSEACWQMNRRVHFAPGEDQVRKFRDSAE